jgi:glycosyltransferase involved in cell wall biosynthesis
VTYNHRDFIRDAMEGFIKQRTDFNFEIIVHDDASTDGTTAIILEYAEKYPNIVIPVIQKENQYSKGAKIFSAYLYPLAKGKYIASCEGDDYWTDENKLQKQVDYMKQNPDCSLCFHSVRIIDASTKIQTGVLRPYTYNTKSPIEDIIKGGGGYCHTVSLLFLKECINKIPKFYYESHVGDYPLQMYLATKGHVFYIDENMADYRTGVKGSWTSKPNTLSRKEAKMHYNKIYENDIALLDKFNEYTNFIYNKIIEDAIKQKVFNIYINNIDIKAMKNSGYIDLYKKLGVVRKIKLYIEKFFPFIFKLKTIFTNN